MDDLLWIPGPENYALELEIHGPEPVGQGRQTPNAGSRKYQNLKFPNQAEPSTRECVDPR